MSWTVEAEQYVDTRARAGDSNAQIARDLEAKGLGVFTKNAVSGKIHRLGARVKPFVAKAWPTNNQAHRFCQFPLWGHDEKPNGKFCRKPVYRTRPYCEDCCEVAYRDPRWKDES